MHGLRFIKKDSNSPAGNCAAITATKGSPIRYQLDSEPGYIVQVVTLTVEEEMAARAEAEANGVGLSDHEAIGWVPANLIEGLVEERSKS